MDEQTKQRMRQAVEFAKKRVAQGKTELSPSVSTVAVKQMEENPEEEAQDKIIAIADTYPDRLFRTLPNKYSKNPDDLCYPCPTCGEVPGLIRRRNGYGRRACQCVRQEQERQDAQRFHEYVRQERLSVPVKERITYTWLGTDYSKLAACSLGNFEVQYQRDAFVLVGGFVKRMLAKSANQENVLIYGDKAGLGKTHLAAAMLNCAYENGYSCLFMLAKDYFDALWGSDFKDRLALRQRAAKADYLLIDDIDKAKQKDTSTMKAEFFQLLNMRYVAGRPTFFTANSSDLALWFDEWTISRVQERLLRIPVAGQDFRVVLAERARQGVHTGLLQK